MCFVKYLLIEKSWIDKRYSSLVVCVFSYSMLRSLIDQWPQIAKTDNQPSHGSIDALHAILRSVLL